MVNKTMSHPANNIRRDDNYFEVSGKFITDIWSQVRNALALGEESQPNDVTIVRATREKTDMFEDRATYHILVYIDGFNRYEYIIIAQNLELLPELRHNEVVSEDYKLPPSID